MYAENRSERLWIPQGTEAQNAQESYKQYWPSFMRSDMILVEGNSGNALTKAVLTGALGLHADIEKVTAGNDTLRTLCFPKYANGHPCLINSILSMWNFDAATLAADLDPLATINAAGKTKEDLTRMLGTPVFDANDKVVSAKAFTIHYFLSSHRVNEGSRETDPRGEAWEEAALKVLKCDAVCEAVECTCPYPSNDFKIYVWFERSFSDAFGTVIRGDVGLINAAFFIMIVYVTLNLGGLCHKIKSRALLALGCIFTIVISGVAGYGIAMYMQFDYTPVMSVLPFVMLGIGVDDSFVIMNALDHTDPKDTVPERIAHAISHAGVSVMFTSLTDFTAFAISVSSALPALSAFCMYAALSVLMLFVFQVTVFTAFATFDARRVADNRIDCCPCICRKGCPCCPIVFPVEDAITEDGRDKNQLLCNPHPHPGGRLGWFLENKMGPFIVKTPVALTFTFVCVAFCAFCAWQSTMLDVEDITDKFIPDDSYVQTVLKKQGQLFGAVPRSVDIICEGGDYHATQVGLASMGTKISALGFFEPPTADTWTSWADAYVAALKVGVSAVGATVAVDANGIATVKSEYYAGLAAWLGGQGGKYKRDVVWVDDTDPQQGIRASRVAAVLKPIWKADPDGKLDIDTDKAVTIVDGVMNAAASWTDLPGGKGKTFAFLRDFLSWEVFRIIKKEMFMSVGLCLLAVFCLTMVILAHPGVALLVVLVVIMTIVDLLGCMQLWGLAIDSVSVIQLVIAVGLAVDYAAHIGHNFMTKGGSSRADRVVETLADTGSAVLNGGISTFLAVMLLASSKSYVFRVLFQTFFLTVVLGLIHGMVLLPVLLSLMGPQGYAGRVKDKVGVPGSTVGKTVE